MPTDREARLLNQANIVKEVAKFLTDWGKRILSKRGAQSEPKTGHPVFPDKSDTYVDQKDRQASRNLVTLISRHHLLLENLLAKYGCHEGIRPYLRSLLDLPATAVDKDTAGYWSRAQEYAGEHLCGGKYFISGELTKWAANLEAEAGQSVTPTEFSTPADDKTTQAKDENAVPAAQQAPAEPLTEKAANVLELLKELPPNRGMKGPDILKKLDIKGLFIDQGTLTKSIIPALKPYGVKNKRGAGYYIRPPK